MHTDDNTSAGPPPIKVKRGPTSFIEESGLGSEIVRLMQNGMDAEAVAKVFNLPKEQVQTFVRKYNKMEPEERKEVVKKDIMQVFDRLQDQYTQLTAILQDAMDSGKVDEQTKVMTEMRHHLALAATVAEKMMQLQQYEKFREIVLDELNKEAPGIKARCLQRLKEQRENFNLLKPF